MTTHREYCPLLWVLWFAQNSLPLWLKWQPSSSYGRVREGCDLLKIHYLCGWNDNLRKLLKRRNTVVICSKFITFVVEMTTDTDNVALAIWLWFAQNSLPLWLKWQLFHMADDATFGCDLLKIHYLCGWNDNLRFHLVMYHMLWFAQNSLPLWLKWQLSFSATFLKLGCDLLKIHYLCGWNDNRWARGSWWWLVVICSKFITFVVEMTTNLLDWNKRNVLWFAQNSLPLWLKWQHKFYIRLCIR